VNVDLALLAQEELLAPARAEDVAAARASVAQAEAQLAQLLERPKAEDVALAKAQLAQLYERPREADVQVYEAQVREADVALAQAREALDDALIVAPFDGKVLSVAVNEGEWATLSAPALAVADTHHLLLKVLLDEVDVAALSEGQLVRITFEALPEEEVVGTVKTIAPNATDTASGVAYQADISFEPGDLPVRLGMTANVDIVTHSLADALLVPTQAITADREAGRYYVTVQDALGGTRQVEVEIGLRNDESTQVVSGLQEGATLVLATVDYESATSGRSDFQGPMGGRMMGASGGGQ
jgi:HlyD family secretion protein